MTYGKDPGHGRDVKTKEASADTCEGSYKVLEATLSSRRGVLWSCIPGSSQSLLNTERFGRYRSPYNSCMNLLTFGILAEMPGGYLGWDPVKVG